MNRKEVRAAYGSPFSKTRIMHIQIKWLPVVVLAGLILSCGSKQRGQHQEISATELLQDTAGWAIEKLADGLVKYHYTGYDSVSAANQNVNIVAVDLDRYRLAFDDQRPSDSLSSIVKRHPDAVAAINGTYYEIARNEAGDSVASSFFKTDGVIKSTVTIPEDHQLYWKHEGAFFYDPSTDTLGIVYGSKESYEAMPFANALSGSPMLVYADTPVGETFAKPREIPLDSLDYEDPDRHQGVRHPRTAVALTKSGYLMLIAVDGRRPETAGMSAKELTRFLVRYFDPQYALNLDGGGSTTLWMKQSDAPNGVVNYPTDNKQYNHYGQRKIRNAIVVLEKTQ